MKNGRWKRSDTLSVVHFEFQNFLLVSWWLWFDRVCSILEFKFHWHSNQNEYVFPFCNGIFPKLSLPLILSHTFLRNMYIYSKGSRLSHIIFQKYINLNFLLPISDCFYFNSMPRIRWWWCAAFIESHKTWAHTYRKFN